VFLVLSLYSFSLSLLKIQLIYSYLVAIMAKICFFFFFFIYLLFYAIVVWIMERTRERIADLVWKQNCSCFCLQYKFICKFRIQLCKKNQTFNLFFFYEIRTRYKVQTHIPNCMGVRNLGSGFELSPLPNNSRK